MADLKIAVVASRFNPEITERLIAGAQEALRGVADVTLIHVPGAFEIPLMAKTAALSKRFDAIVAIGCVIRGDTDHYQFVAGEAARGIAEASRTTGRPVIFGVLTTDTVEQALKRASPHHNAGSEAAESALRMVHVMASL